VQGRHKKQTGGHGQFGDCWIRMEPLPRGSKFEFANEVFWRRDPEKLYSRRGERHYRDRCEWIFGGFSDGRFQVHCLCGSYHDVDSSELAFKLAARKAFKNAMQHASRPCWSR